VSLPWDAAEELTGAIRESPFVISFLRAFEAGEEEDDLAARLEGIMTTYSFLHTSPLLVAVRLNHLPEVEDLISDAADQGWFHDALTAGTCFQILIEFIRSRLPAYPQIRVPHRRRGSPYLLETSPTFVHHFPWERELSLQGLQFKDAAEIDGLFKTSGKVAEPLRGLLAGLTEMATWKRFESATADLHDADRQELTELGRRFGELVAGEVVDMEGGEFVIARHQYRMAVLEEVVASASERVLEYFRAFEEVDQLISVLASFMQTLIIRSELPTLRPQRVDFGAGLDVVAVGLLDPSFEPAIHPGVAILIEPEAGSRGVVFPEELNFSLGGSNAATRITGMFVAYPD
jgi:hypothetical protein